MTLTSVSIAPDAETAALTRSHRLATAARITAAARAELCRHPDDLSMRAVARRAGVDPRRLAEHVGSREQLVANVLFEIAHDAHLAVRPVLAATDGGPCRGRLLAVAQAFRRWSLAHPADAWLLLGPRARSEHSRARSGRALRWFYGPAIEICREGVASGQIDLDDECPADRTHRMVHPAVRRGTEGLDPRLVSRAVAVLTGIHGYLTLEACGHVGALFTDADHAFDGHVGSLMDGVGIA